MEASLLTRVTLYNLKTGEARSFHPVDARECLARGGWSKEPPRKKKISSKRGTSGLSGDSESPVSEKADTQE